MNDSDLQVICQVWEILNGIRARYGAPLDYDFDYYDKLVDKLDKIIEEKTKNPAHCNPLLYKDFTNN